MPLPVFPSIWVPRRFLELVLVRIDEHWLWPVFMGEPDSKIGQSASAPRIRLAPLCPHSRGFLQIGLPSEPSPEATLYGVPSRLAHQLASPFRRFGDMKSGAKSHVPSALAKVKLDTGCYGFVSVLRGILLLVSL